MSSAKDLREARRRRILERGGDRLAYITGQVKVLPPAELPSAVASPPGESGLKSLSIAGELPSSIDEAHLSTGGPSYDAKDITEKPTGVRDELQSLDSVPEESAPLLPPSSIPGPVLSTSQRQEDASPPAWSKTTASSKTRPNFHSAAVVKSIEQTAVVRAILAFLLGVVLVTQQTYSTCHLRWASERQESILGWPVPVILVLITDLTVVVGALLLGLVKVSPGSNKENLGRGGADLARDSKLDQVMALTSQLEGALDLGILVTKGGSGLISDISLYLVTVISAASIAQHFQPALCTSISGCTIS